MLHKETWKNPLMKKMLIFLGILFGVIIVWKLFTHHMISKYMASMKNQAQTVSAMKVDYSLWVNELQSVASIRAIVGVNVTTELAGMITNIYFRPGARVEKGTVLVQLNADAELGQLHALQAQAELAKITYDRDLAQYKVRAVSKQQVDTDEWNLKNLIAQIAQQAATVAKKTIRAPFSGRLGISSVNPGQYLNVGDTITTLQTLNPIYADFYLTQESLAEVELGQNVSLTTDTYKGLVFHGKLTTIEPLADLNTRNIKMEATFANPQEKLIPGMYVPVKVTVGKPAKFLTVPQTAVTFNPYGDVVFVIKKNKSDKEDKEQLTAHQQFVTTGRTRGDQIQILTGLKAGDMVVTSGQLKLQNNSVVTINNAVQPANNPAPDVVNK